MFPRLRKKIEPKRVVGGGGVSRTLGGCAYMGNSSHYIVRSKLTAESEVGTTARLKTLSRTHSLTHTYVETRSCRVLE